jgi:hypothetical protein
MPADEIPRVRRRVCKMGTRLTAATQNGYFLRLSAPRNRCAVVEVMGDRARDHRVRRASRPGRCALSPQGDRAQKNDARDEERYKGQKTETWRQWRNDLGGELHEREIVCGSGTAWTHRTYITAGTAAGSTVRFPTISSEQLVFHRQVQKHGIVLRAPIEAYGQPHSDYRLQLLFIDDGRPHPGR